MEITGQAPDIWNLRSRARKAVAYLSGISDQELDSTIWSRLQNEQSPYLPRFERHEYPADLFIDIVYPVQNTQQVDLANRIRRACARLIGQRSEGPITDASTLGELVFLSARIEAVDAVDPVARLASHQDAESRLGNGQTLRAQALRALTGLLASHPERANEFHKDIFQKWVKNSAFTLIAATALVGLFNEDPKILKADLRESGIRIDDPELDLSLRVAGLKH